MNAPAYTVENEIERLKAFAADLALQITQKTEVIERMGKWGEFHTIASIPDRAAQRACILRAECLAAINFLIACPRL